MDATVGASDLRFSVALIFGFLFGSYEIEPILIVEDSSLFPSADSNPPERYPLICNESKYTVQIIWSTDSGTVPPVDVVEKITPILEQVNGLFFRDSNSYTDTKLPMWGVDENCQLDILYLPVGSNFLIEDNTKYLIIENDNSYCGKANIWEDDKPVDNKNNESSLIWIATHCLNYYIVAHELMHSLGAAQLSAPNSNGGYHVTDFGDVLASPAFVACIGHDSLDCNHDDYFSAKPAGYLQTHWNTWDSPYLVSIPRYTQILPLILNKGNPK